MEFTVILTGLDVEGIIGNVMVPTMIVNTYINFYCLKIPDLYPKQWEKRGVRYPRWLWNVFSIIGGAFAIVVIYNTFINMEPEAMIICVIEVRSNSWKRRPRPRKKPPSETGRNNISGRPAHPAAHYEN